MIGTSISRYDILEELGQGGMSVVYLARDTGLHRQVAVKVMHTHLATKTENRKRFRREAEAIARLRHPNILDVYDVSESSEARAYIVMEFVEGMNLRQYIEHHGPPPAEVVCLIAAQLCNALAHAHQHGVIHRDLKPENVMISSAGQVKLMDFGIAHVIGAETMTSTGSLIGSPAHMAPEMIDGARVDARADIFALGTVLYWMSTGRLPFSGENTPQVLRNVMEGRYEPAELVEPKISHDLARIITRTLHAEPAERFASAEALKRELYAAVHAVGYDDDEAMLGAYFADPEGYRAQFEREIVGRLIQCGRQAAQRQSTPAAIAYFNRVLAYDPQNQEVHDCLKRLRRGRQAWLGGAVAIALCVAAGGGWLMYTNQVEANQQARADLEAQLRAATEGAARQVAAHQQVMAGVESARGAAAERLPLVQGTQSAESVARHAEALAARLYASRSERQIRHISMNSTISRRPVVRRLQHADKLARIKPEARKAPDEASKKPVDPAEQSANTPAQAATVPVQFRVFPPPTRLEIDGKPVQWQLGAVHLAPGEHLLSATAPGCKPYRESLVVNERQNAKIPVVLEWKDALVRVESNRNVLVYVDDETNPRANAAVSTIRVPFARGTFYTPRTLNLRINDSANLQRVQTREVLVEPGESQVVRVNFP